MGGDRRSARRHKPSRARGGVGLSFVGIRLSGLLGLVSLIFAPRFDIPRSGAPSELSQGCPASRRARAVLTSKGRLRQAPGSRESCGLYSAPPVCGAIPYKYPFGGRHRHQRAVHTKTAPKLRDCGPLMVDCGLRIAGWFYCHCLPFLTLHALTFFCRYRLLLYQSE